MTKLNFGCGHRFAKGWVNIDFHAADSSVQRVNLLRRWPFPDAHFDVVYSSHTLEHFTPASAEWLLLECRRTLRPKGIIRIVLPDLESTCREYLRVLDQVNNSELARRQYDWIILELLDQMTRTESSGPMSVYRTKLNASGDKEMNEYVRSRTDTNPWDASRKPFSAKLRGLTFDIARNKLVYLYVAAVKKLLPPSLRESIVDNTRIGEKHKWMYDRHNLAMLMTRCGFCDIKFLSADRSDIPGFSQDGLDLNPDGSSYKACSLYCEGRKP